MLLRPLRRQEELARQNLARARSEAQTVEARLMDLRRNLSAQNDFARHAVTSGGTAASLASYRRQVVDISVAMTQEQRRLAASLQAVEQTRQSLLGAMKQRKAMEQLARKLASRQAVQTQRRGVKELDDIHAARQAWRRAEQEAGILKEAEA